MRKRKKGRKFHRPRDQRRALLGSLATALILKERIKTTEVKAKELRSFVERQITCAKRGDLAARKELARTLAPKIANKLFKEVGPRYKDRQGGYTRITKIGRRTGDGARMAFIELVL